MQNALAELKAACDALPPFQAQRVACPIFGNTPPPPALPTAGLPPLLAQASAELAHALASPPSLADKWPFADPPGVAAARAAREAADKAKGGRPSGVQPHQVVRLVRFVKLGDSMSAAAKKAGLSKQAASRVLSGQVEVAHHPAVTAAGVSLPPLMASETRPKPRQDPERVAQATTPASWPLTGQESPVASEAS